MNGCRVCMTEEADIFLSLFTKPDKIPFAEMINNLTGLNIVKGDDLPRFICKECSEDVLRSYKIRLKCLESDKQLRISLEKTHQRIKMVESFFQKEIHKESTAEPASSVFLPEVLKNVVYDEKFMEMIHSGNQLIEVQENHESDSTVSVTIDNNEQSSEEFLIKQECGPTVHNVIDAKDDCKENDSITEKTSCVTIVEEKELDEECSSIQNEDEDEIDYAEEYLEVAEEDSVEVQYTIKANDNIDQAVYEEKSSSDFTQDEYSGKFICCGCEKHFSSNEELLQHSANEHEKMRLKNSAKPYECSICFKRFLSEPRLILHQTYVYREKNHVCDKCNSKFTCRGSLLNHMKTHADRTYNCEDCNKSFHTSSTLKSHRLLHTESKQFQCTAPNCQKSFLRKSDLHIHLVSHSDERPYECDLCSSRFKSKAHLVHHGKVHTREKPYKCNQCDKAFGTYSARKFHQLAHEGIHPYKCNYCDKIYQRNAKLQVHIRRIHTGERPFACDLCENVRFYQNWELTAHKRSVHKMDVLNEYNRESTEGGTEEEEESLNDEEFMASLPKPKRTKHLQEVDRHG